MAIFADFQYFIHADIVGRVGQKNSKNMHEIARFLKSLFSSQLARESDLVYTFFHPLLRDQQDADIHLPKLRGMLILKF